MKTRFIGDNVHGSIPFSSFIENSILKNPLFNRLQGIKQNSTAYKTYPSLDYSRFIHSIGTMHIATMIFYNSILNSKSEYITEFLDSFTEYLELELKNAKKLLKNKYFVEQIYQYLQIIPIEIKEQIKNQILQTSDSITINKFKPFFIKDRIFSIYNPRYLIEDEKFSINYSIILQAIRITALFHDLGHPPFSHAVEFAIQDIFKRFEKKKFREGSYEEKYFIILKKYLNYILINLNIKQFKNFHESVTVIFIKNIFDFILSQLWNLNIKIIKNNICEKSVEKTVKLFLYYNILKSLTISLYIGYPLYSREDFKLKFIKNKNNNRLESAINSINSIISGKIDADRLDYVIRDGQNSSLHYKSFNLSRIVNNFILYYNKDKDVDQFSFSPSVRSLNDIEKFFRDRLSIYRYIIFHHNVVKTDLILYKITSYIFELIFMNGLISKNEQKEKISHEFLEIWRNFWEYLKYSDSNLTNFQNIELFISRASGWNENLFLSAIHNSYQILYEKIIKKEQLTSLEKKLYVLLKEFLYNQRNLLSLWKRNYFFSVYVKTQIKNILEEKEKIFDKISKFKNHSKYDPEAPAFIPVDEKIELFKSCITYIDSKYNKNNIDELFINDDKAKDFIFKCIKSVFEIMKKLNPIDIENQIEDDLKKRLTKIFNNSEEIIPFVKILAHRLVPGVESNYQLIHLSEFENVKPTSKNVDEISSILNELEGSSYFSPQFYVYLGLINNFKICRPEISDDKLNQIYKILSLIIIKNFKKTFKISNINNIIRRQKSCKTKK